MMIGGMKVCIECTYDDCWNESLYRVRVCIVIGGMNVCIECMYDADWRNESLYWVYVW